MTHDAGTAGKEGLSAFAKSEVHPAHASKGASVTGADDIADSARRASAEAQ